MIGRLLYEISWEGNAKTGYRKGGRGRENVLTTEALQILDFLPRREFLGNVILAMNGAVATRDLLVSEIDDANLEVLPQEILLSPSASTRKAQAIVQPDGHLRSTSVYCLIEVKRIKPSSFQTKQLAREIVAAIQHAGERTPMVALLLGNPPPVNVTKHGRLSIEEAINLHLARAIDHEAEAFVPSVDEVRTRLHEIICWITWREIGGIVAKQAREFSCEPPSVAASVSRMAKLLETIISWHSR